MAVLTLFPPTSTFGPSQEWFPDFFAHNLNDPSLSVNGSPSLVTVSGFSPLAMATFTIEIIGVDFTSYETEDTGWPLTGDVQTVTLSINDELRMTVTDLSIGLTDIFHFMFGWNQFFYPRPGNGFDVFSLMLAGNDTITGTDGHDQLIGGRNTGNDVFFGGRGDDYINADAGNDSIFGGEDEDIYSLAETFFDATAFRGADVNLATGVAIDSWGGTDVLQSIEAVIGSRMADRFTGSSNDEQFIGLRGNDTINGGGGFDIVAYDRDFEFGGQLGVVVDFSKQRATDGWGNVDTLLGIEGAIGTAGNDTFIGNAADNYFAGAMGADSFRGGAGRDTVDFYMDFQFVGAVVNMGLRTNQVRNDGHGNVESLVSIEDLWGTRFADRFTGNAQANMLFGDDGNDTLLGGAGDDTLEGGIGADILTGGIGADSFRFSKRFSDGDPWGDRITDFTSGTDKLTFVFEDFAGMDGTLRFRNGTSAGTSGESWFYFDGATDRLFWDADGLGGNAAVLVATLTGVTALTVADFELI